MVVVERQRNYRVTSVAKSTTPGCSWTKQGWQGSNTQQAELANKCVYYYVIVYGKCVWLAVFFGSDWKCVSK